MKQKISFNIILLLFNVGVLLVSMNNLRRAESYNALYEYEYEYELQLGEVLDCKAQTACTTRKGGIVYSDGGVSLPGVNCRLIRLEEIKILCKDSSIVIKESLHYSNPKI